MRERTVRLTYGKLPDRYLYHLVQILPDGAVVLHKSSDDSHKLITYGTTFADGRGLVITDTAGVVLWS